MIPSPASRWSPVTHRTLILFCLILSVAAVVSTSPVAGQTIEEEIEDDTNGEAVDEDTTATPNMTADTTDENESIPTTPNESSGENNSRSQCGSPPPSHSSSAISCGAPDKTRYDIPPQLFHSLWSHEPTNPDAIPANATQAEALRATTDISFSDPPEVTRYWNSRVVREHPDTDDTTSIYPETATTKDSSDEGWLKDGYAEVAAISPTTYLQTAPGKETRYAAQDGEIFGRIDYRYDSPTNYKPRPDKRVRYTNKDSWIDSVQIVAGSQTITTPPEQQLVASNYTIPSGDTDLGIRATFKAEAVKIVEIEVCTSSSCGWERQSKSLLTDQLTVRDTVSVRQYDPRAVGAIRTTTFADSNETGIVANPNQPWDSIQLGTNTTVEGNWRYYTGRDEGWDTLYRRNNTINPVSSADAVKIQSPVAPLQTYGFPSRYGTKINGETTTTEILSTNGEQYAPPELHPNVSVDTVPDTYQTDRTLAIKSDTNVSNVTFTGIVANQTVSSGAQTFLETPHTESQLNTTIVETNNSHMRLKINLTTTDGEPITTDGYENGFIEVGSQQVDTNASGIATVTTTRTPRTVRYKPEPFVTRTSGAYTDSIDSVNPGGSFDGLASAVFPVVFALGLLFLPIWMIGRLLNLDYWPPWEVYF